MATPPLLYVFPTYAAAISALGNGDLPNGARVEVERDENQTPAGRRYRYDASVPGTGLSDLVRPAPFATLDDEGRLVELLSPGSAGVIDSADYTTLADAIAAANAAPVIQGLRLRAGVHTLETPEALDEGIELLFDPGAVVDLTYHIAELVVRAPIRASRRQIFRCSVDDSASLAVPGRKVVFEGLSRGPVPVEWFGVLPQNSAAENDAAILTVLGATRVVLNTAGDPGWLPVSFGVGTFTFGAPIAFGTRAVRGEGHLVTNRSKRGGGYAGPFSGTILRFPTLATGVAVTVGDVAVDPSPFRVSGLAILGPNNDTATSTGLFLRNCIEASFEDVCVASFGVGIDGDNVQGCSFDRLDVWGCEVGLRSRWNVHAASNTVSNFNFNNCETAAELGLVDDTAASLPDLPPEAVTDDPPLQTGAKEWRFIGGTIQGGNADLGRFLTAGVRMGAYARACMLIGVYFEVTLPVLETAEMATVQIAGGSLNALYGCRFHGANARVAVIGGAGKGQHAFRDCRSDDPVPVKVMAGSDARPVTFDNCEGFDLTDETGLARIVGGYNAKTAPDALDRMPARVGFDQDKGLIEWAAPENAPLQFTSVKPFVPPQTPPPIPDPQAQVLMQAARRGGPLEPEQVSLWSLRTAGEERQLVQISNALGDLAFEFDTVTPHAITDAKNNAVNTGDPTTDVVIKNMRTRIKELEDILRAVVKTIS